MLINTQILQSLPFRCKFSFKIAPTKNTLNDLCLELDVFVRITYLIDIELFSVPIFRPTNSRESGKIRSMRISVGELFEIMFARTLPSIAFIRQWGVVFRCLLALNTRRIFVYF